MHCSQPMQVIKKHYAINQSLLACFSVALFFSASSNKADANSHHTEKNKAPHPKKTSERVRTTTIESGRLSHRVEVNGQPVSNFWTQLTDHRNNVSVQFGSTKNNTQEKRTPPTHAKVSKQSTLEVRFDDTLAEVIFRRTSDNVTLSDQNRSDLKKTIHAITTLNAAEMEGLTEYAVKAYKPNKLKRVFRSEKVLSISDFVIKLLEGEKVGLSVIYAKTGKSKAYVFEQIDQFWTWMGENHALFNEAEQITQRRNDRELAWKETEKLNAKKEERKLVEEAEKTAAQNKRKLAFRDSLTLEQRVLLGKLTSHRDIVYDGLKGAIKIHNFKGQNFDSIENQYTANERIKLRFQPFPGEILPNGKEVDSDWRGYMVLNSMEEITHFIESSEWLENKR